MLQVYGQGFALAMGLIAAIGAQNAFVLAQGLKRHHHAVAAGVCCLCDTVLILAGIAGLGTLISQSDLLMHITRYGGAAFLFTYGAIALKRAVRPARLAPAGPNVSGRRAIALTTLAVTLLNPHVYLDTVVLIGSLGGQIPAADRPYFAAGAVSASLVWFTTISFGAARAAPYLARPATWRIIDLLTAVVMAAVAIGLLV